MRSKYCPAQQSVTKEALALDALTVGVATDCELDILGDINLDHGRLIVYNLLDGDNDLVDVLAVKELASLEPLDHVVNEFLCHGVSQPYTIVVILNNHRVQIKTSGSGRFVTNFDSGKEGELAHNLLAFFQFKSGILVVRVKPDTFLKVFDGFFRPEDGGLG